MGNTASKTANKIAPSSKPASTTLEQNFGREIIKNIKLKESPIILHKPQRLDNFGDLVRRRFELNRSTQGTISWDEFPFLLSQEKSPKFSNISQNEVDELKRHISIPKTTAPIK